MTCKKCGRALFDGDADENGLCCFCAGLKVAAGRARPAQTERSGPIEHSRPSVVPFVAPEPSSAVSKKED